MSKSFLDAYEEYADARNKARRDAAREIQLLVATPSNDGIRMRAVMDGKEQDFFVSRQTAASIVANIAEALADKNQH